MKCYLYTLTIDSNVRFKMTTLDEAYFEGEPLDVVSTYSSSMLCMISKSSDMKEEFYRQVGTILENDLSSMQRLANRALDRFSSFNRFWKAENERRMLLNEHERYRA